MGMTWRVPGTGPCTGIEWDRVAGGALRIDPYLVWADLTALLGFSRPAQEDGGYLPVAIEFSKPGLPTRGEGTDCVFGHLRIGGAYLFQDDTLTTRYRHLTALIQPRAVQHLLTSPLVQRFQLGLPRVPEADFRPVVLPSGGPGVVIGVIDDGCAFAHPSFASADGGSRVVALWDQDSSRTPDKHQGWSEVQGFGYGAQLSKEAIRAALMAAGRQAGVLDRDPLAPYRHVDYVPVRPEPWVNANSTRHGPLSLPAGTMAGATHGTGVLDLAIGMPPPLGPPGSPPVAPAPRDLEAVFVQLPTRTLMDTSGGSLAVHVLDAVHYILTAVKTAGSHVINISYGAIAGGHDGNSVLESALEELVRHEQINLWVVVAAGNAHRSRTHARMSLTPGASNAVVWVVAPDHPHETYLELWLPAADREGHALAPEWVNDLVFSVHPPTGEPLARLRVGDVRVFDASDGADASSCAGAAIFLRHVAQTGSGGTMLLLALAPTARALPGEGPSRSLAPAGEWSVQVHWKGTGADVPVVELHAWTERNDLLYGRRRGQQSTVWGDDPEPEATEAMPETVRVLSGSGFGFKTPASRDLRLAPDYSLGTLAGVRPGRDPLGDLRPGADGGGYVVVGGYRLSDGEMSGYSSGGPARGATLGTIDGARRQAALGRAPDPGKEHAERIAPDVDAPSDAGSALRGIRVVGTLPGRVARLSGTSAAAPTVTRFIAESLAAGQAPSLAVCDDRPAPQTRTWRLTPSPVRDDAFRRGRRRIRSNPSGPGR